MAESHSAHLARSHLSLSIIIVNYRTPELTVACLESVYAQTTQTNFEVLVVDNASCDGSAERIRSAFPTVQLLEMPENLGFARANNMAAEYATGDHLLLLNSDTVVLDHAIDRLMEETWRNPRPGVWGGRTFFDDGSLNPTSCWARPSPWSLLCHGLGATVLFRRHRLFDPESYGRWPRDTRCEVDIVSGCFLLIRRDLWEQLGGFAPAFFMYGEDADLCLRARMLGARPVVCPDAQVIHYGGRSDTVRADKMARLFKAKAQLISRHWTPGWARFGRQMLRLWCLTRAAAWRGLAFMRPKHLETAAMWRNVWQRRHEWLESARG